MIPSGTSTGSNPVLATLSISNGYKPGIFMPGFLFYKIVEIKLCNINTKYYFSIMKKGPKVIRDNIKVEHGNADAVRLAIIGTVYNIASFYEEAATEKIERDNLRKWIETPKTLNNGKRD